MIRVRRPGGGEAHSPLAWPALEHWIPAELQLDRRDLPALRRLAAETFTRRIHPTWLRQLVVFGADQIIWRTIIHTAHASGSLAATGTTALCIVHEETSGRTRAELGAVARVVLPIALLALGLATVSWALTGVSGWLPVWHLVRVAIVGTAATYIVLVLFASLGGSGTVPELVRLARRRHLHHFGYRTWTATALAGEGGFDLLFALKDHISADVAITVSAAGRRQAIVYRRWLTPIPYPRWMTRPDPARALERVSPRRPA